MEEVGLLDWYYVFRDSVRNYELSKRALACSATILEFWGITSFFNSRLLSLLDSLTDND